MDGERKDESRGGIYGAGHLDDMKREGGDGRWIERERERERERGRKRKYERQSHKETERKRQSEKEGGRKQEM